MIASKQVGHGGNSPRRCVERLMCPLTAESGREKVATMHVQAFGINELDRFFTYSSGDRDFTLNKIKPEFGKQANAR